MRRNGPKQQWKRLVEQLRRNLREADEKDAKEPGEDSLDNQIDRLFSDYESEAKSVKAEGLDWRRTVRRILEAEGDEEEGEEEKQDDADEEGAEEEPEEPKKLTADDIQVEDFLEGVMRLVDNYDSLLEVRNTILRRAVNFLNKSYEPDVITQFKDALRENYGFDIGKSVQDVRDEQFPAPPADRAGGTGGGGGGV
jgi:hypothetical protein